MTLALVFWRLLGAPSTSELTLVAGGVQPCEWPVGAARVPSGQAGAPHMAAQVLGAWWMSASGGQPGPGAGAAELAALSAGGGVRRRRMRGNSSY